MATNLGQVRPGVLLYREMLEALGQSRVELVKRETQLMQNIISRGPTLPAKCPAQIFLEETRAEIARIDSLFEIKTKPESQRQLS